MNENKSAALREAKLFWLVGLTVEIILSLVYFLPLFFHNHKLIIPPHVLNVLWLTYPILILVAMKFISVLLDDRKIFNYYLAIFVITILWALLKNPISRFAWSPNPTTAKEISRMMYRVLFLQDILSWSVELAIAILYFLMLWRISIHMKDSRFKLSGILRLTGVAIFVGYGPINFAMEFKQYFASKPPINMGVLPKISSVVWGTSGLIILTSFVILFIAVSQMNYKND